MVLELSSSYAEPQPDETRQHRLLFSTHYTHGHFTATLNGGIIAGLGPLWEHKEMEVVAGCLDSIWEDPAGRQDLIFYDKGCALRRYGLHHPDDSWFGTRHFVDRFHFRGHSEVDCSEFCSPEARDDPTLWGVDDDGNECFL